MGDIILAAKSAYFLQAFRRIGLVPDCGSTWMLPRLVGKSRAVELSLLGERLPAEKALEWGMINRVLDDCAAGGARRRSSPTISPTARPWRWRTSASSTGRARTTRSRSSSISKCRRRSSRGGAEDHREGVAAFLEKRPAKFTGR